MVSIATWNVNSVRSRLPQVLAWMKESPVDVICLQELKCVDEQFPRMEIEEMGYNIALHGQKTYNGVAILSKLPIDDVVRGLPGDETDEQARYIEAVISTQGSAVRVASIYVPNGQSPDSDKFAYKMRFYERLYAHAKQLLTLDEPVILGGDYNCAPYAMDVYAPQALEGSVCFHPAERAHLRALMHLGLHDAYRLKHPDAHEYSWWDYRENGWAQNKGLRIDHLLLSPHAADRLKECEIHKDIRGQEKSSDHVPVVVELDI